MQIYLFLHTFYGISIVFCRFLLTFFRTNDTIMDKLRCDFLGILSKNATGGNEPQDFLMPKEGLAHACTGLLVSYCEAGRHTSVK